MVAYSFRPRFIVPILVGLDLVTPGAGELTVGPFVISSFVRANLPLPKRQTIRANGKRRHARPGEDLQHYTGMRTKQCRLIARAKCSDVAPIEIVVRSNTMRVTIAGRLVRNERLNDFARADGFVDKFDMLEFWREEHGPGKFEGVLIRWEGC